MYPIVILSMHRSGSSLTTSIVQKLGIHIGDRLLGTHPSQPRGHYENVEFYELNMDILRTAGGDWQNPPGEARINAVANRFRERIKGTIAKNKKKKWGWKDPRTCLTLPLYLPYLQSPRFILVYRETDGIIGSLLRRSGGTKEKWERVTRTYQAAMEKHTSGFDTLRVQYEMIVNKKFARAEIGFINSFIGGNNKIDNALSLVDFRT